MHSEIPGSTECQESCVFLLDPSLICGSCDTYSISLQLIDIPSDDQTVFTSASERWESIIVGDVRDILYRPFISDLFPILDRRCTIPNTIDDIYICATYETIDGNGRIIGSAGYKYRRVSGQPLPVVGYMNFDIDDIRVTVFLNLLSYMK